jgi:outer membrane protein assembly factor BamB
MTEKTLSRIAAVGTAGVGLTLLTWWFLYNPVRGIAEKVPGLDNRPKSFTGRSAPVEIGAVFAGYDGLPSSFTGRWPRFRGSDFDNISKDAVKLSDRWSEGGPKILWSVDLGEGHAGPIVANGRVYLLDYDETVRADILRCFSFDDGREIWRRGYRLFVKRNHGMSRTVPAATDRFVVTIGPKGQVMCVDARTGDLKWGLDLEKDYGAEVPLWYTGQCPLIDGGTVVLGVGGTSLLIGVDIETGKVTWQTPNPKSWKMSHSSVMPMTIAGIRMYVYFAIGGLAGIAADGQNVGRVLLESAAWNPNVIAPSPISLGDGRIFVAAGYGAGSVMYRISPTGTSFSVEILQTIKPDQGLASEQQTPIYYRGRLFSILPKDAGPNRNEFICCRPEDCRTIVWSSGKTNRFGLGPYLVADDKFFILSDDGILTMIKAGPSEYIQLGRAKILNGVDAWGPMAIAGGRLLARDSRRLVCLDLRAGS